MAYINHDKTREELIKVVTCINNLFNALDMYIGNTEAYKDNAMYSTEYINGKVDDALMELKRVGAEELKSCEKHIAAIKEAEEKNNKIFALDSAELQNAITIINTLGDKVGVTIVCDILDALRGDRKSLDIVKELLEKNNVSIPEEYKTLFLDTNSVLGKFENYLNNLFTDVKNVSLYLNVAREVKKVAFIFNVDVDEDMEKFLKHKRVSMLVTDRLRGAMGLPTEI